MKKLDATLHFSKLSRESYRKHFVRIEDMWREFRALIECRGSSTQRVLDIDITLQVLTLEFDREAIPLNQFEQHDRELFFELLPDIELAIEYCHKRGWVHGDIKPSNILYIPKTRKIKLIDFGASYRIGTWRELLKEWQLTPLFSSQEMISGSGVVNEEDDWFSLNQMLK
ncbi:protein kinase [Vibrio sp. S4M6]|uniref:protein kinase domain-containing protein n=1 Tax=Vibrio sinus TaxID=2946865 RepID=UPI002029F820|nr:protein kinase [Vibrio sinus]MCL9781234.1 protein kinase [Vibrio sinus]